GSMHSFCLVCFKSVSSPIHRLSRRRILRPARRCIQGTRTKRYKHSYASEVKKSALSFHQRILWTSNGSFCCVARDERDPAKDFLDAQKCASPFNQLDTHQPY